MGHKYKQRKKRHYEISNRHLWIFYNFLKWSMILLRGPNVILLNQITKINVLIDTNIGGGGGS